MNPTWTKIVHVIQRHRIVYAITGALLVATLLTVASMALYVSSGASRLDLSRPGYERVRSDAGKSTEEEPFSATGPMNSAVVEEFQARYTRYRDTLKKLDTFSSNALDDTELRIAPSSAE